MHHVFRRPWRALAAVALTLLALPTAAAAAPADQARIDDAIQRGAAWITTQIDDTGTLLGTYDNWGATALAAAGIHPADVRAAAGKPSLQDQIFSTYDAGWDALPSPNSVGAVGREAVISAASGIAPTTIAPGINLAASLASLWDAQAGNFGNTGPLGDGQAIVAADVLHVPRGVVGKVAAYVRSTQKTADGGWSYTSATDDGPSDVDSTGMALSMLCLAGAGVGDHAVDRGLAFLRQQLDPNTGGFAASGPWTPANNTGSAAMALIGLKACGVDPQGPSWTPSGHNPVTFLLDRQRTDGSFEYVPGGARDVSTDVSNSQAAVRALSRYRWAAPAPARAVPTDPRWRPAPTVADGTVVPVAVGVDDGAGDVRFCAVKIPAGTPLTAVLQTASTASVPAGCVRGLRVADGAVATLNGAEATGYRAWRVRINGGRLQPAGTQRVGFGDVVSLEYGAPVSAPPPAPGPPGPAGAPGTTLTVFRTRFVPVPVAVTRPPAEPKEPWARCTVRRAKTKRGRDSVRCHVRHATGTTWRSTARLTRKGRLYAKGRRSRLRQHRHRRLVVGHHYTLRIVQKGQDAKRTDGATSGDHRDAKRTVKIRVTLR